MTFCLREMWTRSVREIPWIVARDCRYPVCSRAYPLQEILDLLLNDGSFLITQCDELPD
jgi:hypothetical protein